MQAGRGCAWSAAGAEGTGCSTRGDGRASRRARWLHSGGTRGHGARMCMLDGCTAATATPREHGGHGALPPDDAGQDAMQAVPARAHARAMSLPLHAVTWSSYAGRRRGLAGIYGRQTPGTRSRKLLRHTAAAGRHDAGHTRAQGTRRKAVPRRMVQVAGRCAPAPRLRSQPLCSAPPAHTRAAATRIILHHHAPVALRGKARTAATSQQQPRPGDKSWARPEPSACGRQDA
jgi:hypothetical protein